MTNDNKAPGIIEYLLFKNATLSAVLATLLVTSFVSVAIIPVMVENPAKAGQTNENR